MGSWNPHTQAKKKDRSQQDDLVVEYELVPALILVLAYELVEAQNLARARILLLPYELLLALILVAAQIPVLPMIIVLACELIEAQNLRTSVSAPPTCVLQSEILSICPSSSHAKAPFRLAGTVT